jgi:hypothetical protein
MKKINVVKHSSKLKEEVDSTSSEKKPFSSTIFKGGDISSYDPETGRIKFNPVVQTPFRRLTVSLKESLQAFQEASQAVPLDEQVEFLFKQFKRTAKALTTHIKKNYPDS